MVRMLVLYEQPTDAAAFDRHYFEVHVPLARRLPGLRRYSVGRDVTGIRGEPHHIVGELEWEDMDSLRRDFGSELGQELARDVDQLAELCPGIRSVVYELEDLT
jgi:uncharacterized protein (TIGR02118 family)